MTKRKVGRKKKPGPKRKPPKKILEITGNQYKWCKAMADEDSETFMAPTKSAEVAYPNAKDQKSASVIGSMNMKSHKVQKTLREMLSADQELRDKWVRSRHRIAEDDTHRHHAAMAALHAKITDELAPEKTMNLHASAEDRTDIYRHVYDIVTGKVVPPSSPTTALPSAAQSETPAEPPHGGEKTETRKDAPGAVREGSD